MRRRKFSSERALAIALVAWLSADAHAQAIPPAPVEHATDEVGLLSPQVRASLSAELAAHEARTGQQILLWIGRDRTGGDLEGWAARTFAAWGVGRKGRDDGVVIFVVPEARRMRIEVGYGLEGVLPDARAGRIIREEMAPRLQRGDADGAARAGVRAVLAAVGGEAQPLVEPEKRLSWGQLIVLGVIGLLFLFLLITNPSLAIALLYTLGSGGHRGGGFGGGGFRGGGGRSGGGGASGSW